MPFGLMDAPAVFQRFIYKVFIYLDGILIYSHFVDELVAHVLCVLQLLLGNYLYVKLEKFIFHTQSVNLWVCGLQEPFEHVPSYDSNHLRWANPTSLCSVQSFRGLANSFHRFIWNFSTMPALLTALSKKGMGHFQRTSEAQKDFEEFK